MTSRKTEFNETELAYRKKYGYFGNCESCGNTGQLRWVVIGKPGARMFACTNCMRDTNNHRFKGVNTEEAHMARLRFGYGCCVCDSESKPNTPYVRDGRILGFLCMTCQQTVGRVKNLEMLERIRNILTGSPVGERNK